MSTEKTTEELVMEYAKNRTEINRISKDIATFGSDEDGWNFTGRDFLDKAFKEFDDLNKSLEYGEFPEPWRGWIALLDDRDDDAPPEARELAALRDRRKELAREGGQIRRVICARGRKLLRDKTA